MRTAIEERLRLMALNIYGLSEITGPGVAVECPERRGMHVAEDHFLPELVDPETLEPVPRRHERVSSCSQRSASRECRSSVEPHPRPDVTRSHVRAPAGARWSGSERIMARSDDMLIIRGVNVYPSQVEHALLQVPELAPHYLLVVRREHTLDTLEVQVETSRGQRASRTRGAQARVALASTSSSREAIVAPGPGRAATPSSSTSPGSPS